MWAEREASSVMVGLIVPPMTESVSRQPGGAAALNEALSLTER